ncbi:MAG: HPr family phosphocarrier protein [Spirochaetes bacterium]|jgi:phosphotransferase system HPr (HPr) family protein|nr:HPr family phosphocarrier protein [Spirochaetota bacterium]
MKELQAEVLHQVGLHARPAARFVKTAKGFDSEIRIRNVTRESDPVNAKSLAKVVKIAAAQNHTVHITADGPDEEAAIEALRDFLTNVPEDQE